MRRVSLVTIVTACACAGVAHAGGGPGAVYNDYAQDGVLSCNHSHADLVAVLRSGSLNQYGDPFTLAGLKLAVRKQLAGGCRHHGGAGQNGTVGGGAPGGGGGGRTGGGHGSKGSPGHRGGRHGSKPAPPLSATPSRGSAGGDTGSFVAGRGLIVGLLVAALAFGGWLTKHALAARD